LICSLLLHSRLLRIAWVEHLLEGINECVIAAILDLVHLFAPLNAELLTITFVARQEAFLAASLHRAVLRGARTPTS